MRLDEKFHRERLEGEDGGVESDAKSDDVPIADTKLEQIGKDDLVGRRFAEVEAFLCLHLHDPVDDCAHNAKGGEAQGNQKRRAPGSISGACPCGGDQGGERTQAADGEVDAESETQLFASKPPGERGGDRDIQRFGTHAEYEASCCYDREVT